MATKSRASIAEQLNAAHIAINNSIADEEIGRLIAPLGYHRAKLEEGRKLFEAAVAAVNAQNAAEEDKRIARARFLETEKLARDAFQAFAQAAKASFGRAMLASLGLTGPTPRATAGFLPTAYALFDNAIRLPEIQAKLGELGYNADKLQKEKAKIAAYDLANQAHETSKGKVQMATVQQNQVLDSLQEWIMQYLKIVKVALREKKQLLEKLGITVLNTESSTQSQASSPPVTVTQDTKV